MIGAAHLPHCLQSAAATKTLTGKWTETIHHWTLTVRRLSIIKTRIYTRNLTRAEQNPGQSVSAKLRETAATTE